MASADGRFHTCILYLDLSGGGSVGLITPHAANA